MTAIITKQNAKDKAFIGNGGGGSSDYPTDAEFETIKVNKNATFTVNNKEITFANHETRIVTLEQSSGGGSSTDDSFNHVSGYDYFFVKNENIDSEQIQIQNVDYYKLSINSIPSTTIDSLKLVTEHVNIFRFILRKNEIFDEIGNFIKEFYCYVDNQKLYCPIITKTKMARRDSPAGANSLDHYKIEYVETTWDSKPYIAFDKQVPFVPYDLTLSGEISIMYLLPQNAIESKTPEIKCDIITARNAFRLHESNVPYLYKPSIITENDKNYIMKFYIAPDFTIPTNMEFVFRELIFMNNWTLNWTGKEWTGNNVQGRSNGRMKNMLNRMCGSDYITAIGVSKNDFNTFVINDILKTSIDEKYTLKNVFDKHHPIVNGTYNNGDDFTVARSELPSLQSMLIVNWDSVFSDAKDYPVYDNVYGCPIEMYLDANWNQMNQIKESYLKEIKVITLNLNIGTGKGENIFTFQLTSTEPNSTRNPNYGFAIRIRAVNDVADQLNVCVQESNIDKTDKSVTLYLDKSTLKPRPEINWDSSINPFQFIIDEQFYTVSPNPNAATTLYTDFNITSSKIITADNITTMRSDLNVVANTTDVIDADVKALSTKVDKIEVRVTTVEGKVQYLENEVQKIKIMDDVRMLFSAVSGAVMYGPKLLEIGGNFLKLGTSAIRNLCSRFTRNSANQLIDFLEDDIVDNALPPLVTFALRAADSETKVDFSGLLDWINADHAEPKFSDTYVEDGEDDCNNPENMYVSYYTVHNACLYYRDSLKPAFKLMVDKFDEVDERITKLEKGNLTANPDIERRIAILEAKCKNIVVEDIPVTQNESLTFEQRLAILELKCANIL